MRRLSCSKRCFFSFRCDWYMVPVNHTIKAMIMSVTKVENTKKSRFKLFLLFKVRMVGQYITKVSDFCVGLDNTLDIMKKGLTLKKIWC